MKVDAKEVEALKEAAAKFDEAYVDLMQAYNRLLLILEMPAAAQAPPTSTSTTQKFSGESCPRCHSMRIVRSGPCGRCLECNYDVGCGG